MRHEHFDEWHKFVERWADEWDLEVIYARNEDIGRYIDADNLEPCDDIPISPKYFAGFRSFGSEVSRTKADSEPAWLQDFDTTTERAGRAQDEEDLMEGLRDIGYM